MKDRGSLDWNGAGFQGFCRLQMTASVQVKKTGETASKRMAEAHYRRLLRAAGEVDANAELATNAPFRYDHDYAVPQPENLALLVGMPARARLRCARR